MKANNFLTAETLLQDIEAGVVKKIKALKKPPVLALVWVGSDKQTEKFINAKKKKATDLGINFQLHHFEKIGERQLSALVVSLASNKNIDGIVVQLPLPKNVKDWKILQLIPAEKDVDNLNNGSYSSPTAEGIAELLKHNGLDMSRLVTFILGSGRLVGAPLAKIFSDNSWPFQQISQDASKLSQEIKTGDVLISATGVEGIVSSAMVHNEMVVVDGSGVDVDVNSIQDKVKLITPTKGTVGPLTVMLLMRNVTEAAARRQNS